MEKSTPFTENSFTPVRRYWLGMIGFTMKPNVVTFSCANKEEQERRRIKNKTGIFFTLKIQT